MAHPSVAWPGGTDPDRLSRALSRAHETYLRTGTSTCDVRPVVRESWRRSILAGVDPHNGSPPIELMDDELEEYRSRHPLARVMPVIRQLLLSDVSEDRLIVAIGDAAGRLLWVEGDSQLRTRAAGQSFVEGANWSEKHAGTNAPGTTIATNETVQVFASEHFRHAAWSWSCTAAPIHDPASGLLLGFLDVSGRSSAASPQMLMVIRAAALAAEAELRLAGIEHQVAPARLEVLGRDNGRLVLNGREIMLSPRHSELLLILTLHPEGLTADELAVRLFEKDCSPVTVRAEMNRLRRITGDTVISSRPYRLTAPIETDVAELQGLLERGAHRRALAMYRGAVLPRSEAPDIQRVRETVRYGLRDALIRHANVELLFSYAQSPEGRLDMAVWKACRDRLPLGSPRRTQVQSHLHVLDRELGWC